MSLEHESERTEIPGEFFPEEPGDDASTRVIQASDFTDADLEPGTIIEGIANYEELDAFVAKLLEAHIRRVDELKGVKTRSPISTTVVINQGRNTSLADIFDDDTIKYKHNGKVVNFVVKILSPEESPDFVQQAEYRPHQDILYFNASGEYHSTGRDLVAYGVRDASITLSRRTDTVNETFYGLNMRSKLINERDLKRDLRFLHNISRMNYLLQMKTAVNHPFYGGGYGMGKTRG